MRELGAARSDLPRYYFDLLDSGRPETDEVGINLSGPEEVRAAAMRLLPDVAREEVPQDGDHRAFNVMVRDEGGRPVYAATLTYNGFWFGYPGDQKG